MLLDANHIRQYLQTFDFHTLFIEELGWDRYTSRLDINVDGQTLTLTAVAEKRGMVVFVCAGSLPNYPVRRKIDRQVTKLVHEHLIIYTDKDKTTQIWQWVKREAGKPTACREHVYHRNQPGDALIQKLQALVFRLEEEENLTIVEVTSRARAAFDVDRVTKRFYDRFKTEHAAFLAFLKGIPDTEMQRWYASVMLNRLMFIYFIQKKGFLDSDPHYLRTKLTQSQQRGKDRFYTHFLCPLFFEGFAKRESERSNAANQLLGKVPYLNGGLFLRHQIEELHGQNIRIADAAFEKLFAFFDQYHWHLDERPLRADNEINPDVLGYIFEKYINQKQMGAYYTKEDITEYISKNTVIPFLFDVAKQKCKIAFEGEQSVWRLLQADPDRYIYDAVKHGITVNIHEKPPQPLEKPLPLPPEIAAGLDDVSKRTEWNRPAPPEYALPTEIWREVVARRKRYEEIKAKLTTGEVQSINALITYNLNIRQFAQDVIENCEGPELLRAFWHAIEQVTVLDPTCGSGAFLFAALNILESLYEACLERMEAFVVELERSGAKHRPEKFSDFRKVLKQVAQHPNHRYFILKSIIVNNLYGVDIMEEAIEICKLRLFLKLVAQVERIQDIEPLPDIDFNIRAGNTLVGYATYKDVQRAVTSKLDFDNAMARIEEKAEDVDRLFQLFRQQQTELGGEVTAEDKQELRKRLKALEDELNRHLAGEYGIDPNKKAVYEQWLASHKPFHWFIEFYGIMKSGGFDVIIGNPPYVEISDVNEQYSIKGLSLVTTGNLYSVCVERFVHLLDTGYCSVIIPISSISTPRMVPLMRLMSQVFSSLYLSNFAVRPGKLFIGVDMNLTIMLGEKQASRTSRDMWSTGYNRWQEDYRPFLFDNLSYTETSLHDSLSSIPKIASIEESVLMRKVKLHAPLSRYRVTKSDADIVYYHSGGRYFRKCIREKLSNEYKELALRKGMGDVAICLLSSSLYYWFWIAISDCYHVTKRAVDALPTPDSLSEENALRQLAESFLADLNKNAKTNIRNRADGSQRKEVNFQVGKSKSIINEIDQVLAKYYGFTQEELDFVINYDIKYRGDIADD